MELLFPFYFIQVIFISAIFKRSNYSAEIKHLSSLNKRLFYNLIKICHSADSVNVDLINLRLQGAILSHFTNLFAALGFLKENIRKRGKPLDF